MDSTAKSSDITEVAQAPTGTLSGPHELSNNMFIQAATTFTKLSTKKLVQIIPIFFEFFSLYLGLHQLELACPRIYF